MKSTSLDDPLETTIPAWKQALVVLLFLYPLVMLEYLFLIPHLADMPLAISTFIGNAISVGLLAFPCMPFANRALAWWLLPPTKPSVTLLGTLLMLALFLIEVLLFL